MSPTIAALLDDAVRRLTPVSDTPRLDAEILLGAALAAPRSDLRAWPERVPAAPDRERFAAFVDRRRRGEPVAYLTGRREFWSLPLSVTPATLIPRPETEELVFAALDRIDPERAVHCADLGTGCGAVALVVASERPRAQVVATDVSPDALAVARSNAARLRIANVTFVCGDWFAPLHGSFDIILSNPPYVEDADPHLRAGDVRFEPRRALTAGADGLDALRVIIAQAPAYLAPGGALIVEHGHDQGAAVRALLAGAGFSEITSRCDRAHHERVSGGRRGG